MDMHLLNAFSLNMLPANTPCTIEVQPVSLPEAQAMAPSCTSAVGHADTAAVFGNVLGVPVPCARVNVALRGGETALVGQYRGPRLPEGATVLPAGATIEWVVVTVRA
jgi:hypothetical protein